MRIFLNKCRRLTQMLLRMRIHFFFFFCSQLFFHTSDVSHQQTVKMYSCLSHTEDKTRQKPAERSCEDEKYSIYTDHLSSIRMMQCYFSSIYFMASIVFINILKYFTYIFNLHFNFSL